MIWLAESLNANIQYIALRQMCNFHSLWLYFISIYIAQLGLFEP